MKTSYWLAIGFVILTVIIIGIVRLTKRNEDLNGSIAHVDYLDDGRQLVRYESGNIYMVSGKERRKVKSVEIIADSTALISYPDGSTETVFAIS